MRKSLFIKDLRDTIVFGYSRAKEAGRRLPREYMIEDVFDLEHDAFFDSLEIVFPNNLKSADIKENDVVKDYKAEVKPMRRKRREEEMCC
jgi:hypothetical protein